MLVNNASALQMVTRAVCILEDCEHFKCGQGIGIYRQSEHEMDAAVMDGHDLNAGAAGGIQDVKNPVLPARQVMEKTRCVFPAGEKATDYARERTHTNRTGRKKTCN